MVDASTVVKWLGNEKHSDEVADLATRSMTASILRSLFRRSILVSAYVHFHDKVCGHPYLSNRIMHVSSGAGTPPGRRP